MRAVFVYGTLMRGERRGSLIQSAIPLQVVRARTPGRLVDLGDYPGLVPARRSGQWVIGEFARFETLDHLLPQLDFVEEYLPNSEPQSLYLRRLVQVVLEDGNDWSHAQEWAWTYIYNRPYDPRSIIRGGDWRRRETKPRL